MSIAQPSVYLRRTGNPEPVPVGWSTHPAGTLIGIDLEIVYNPARHDVCRALRPLTAHLARGIGTAGYKRTAALDNGVELWVRDRASAVRASLAGFHVIDGGRVRAR